MKVILSKNVFVIHEGDTAYIQRSHQLKVTDSQLSDEEEVIVSLCKHILESGK